MTQPYDYSNISTGVLRIHRLRDDEFFFTPVDISDWDFLVEEKFKQVLLQTVPLGCVRLYNIIQKGKETEAFFNGELVFTSLEEIPGDLRGY